MERRFGVDIEEIKREMLPDDPNMVRAINLLGSGNFPVGNSHRLVIKGNTVVSVLPPEGF